MTSFDSSIFSPNNAQCQPEVPALLKNINLNFQTITSSICQSNSQPVVIEETEKLIEETRDLLQHLHSSLREKNLLSFPVDVNVDSCVASRQKQAAELLKQNLNRRQANANIIAKTLLPKR